MKPRRTIEERTDGPRKHTNQPAKIETTVVLFFLSCPPPTDPTRKEKLATKRYLRTKLTSPKPIAPIDANQLRLRQFRLRRMISRTPDAQKRATPDTSTTHQSRARKPTRPKTKPTGGNDAAKQSQTMSTKPRTSLQRQPLGCVLFRLSCAVISNARFCYLICCYFGCL